MDKSGGDIVRVFVREWNGNLFFRVEVNHVFTFSNRDISGANEFARKLIVPDWFEFRHTPEELRMTTFQLRLGGWSLAAVLF